MFSSCATIFNTVLGTKIIQNLALNLFLKRLRVYDVALLAPSVDIHPLCYWLIVPSKSSYSCPFHSQQQRTVAKHFWVDTKCQGSIGRHVTTCGKALQETEIIE